MKVMALRMVAACYAYLGRIAEGHALLITLGPVSTAEERFISLFRDSEFETLLRAGLALLDADI